MATKIFLNLNWNQLEFLIMETSHKITYHTTRKDNMENLLSQLERIKKENKDLDY